MSRSVIAQSCAFSKSVKLSFSYMLLPRWNCKLYKWKIKNNNNSNNNDNNNNNNNNNNKNNNNNAGK